MAFITKVSNALVFAAGLVLAKDHFIVEEPMGSEHHIVQASGEICELCFFNEEKDRVNDSKNKFCLSMSGFHRFGFEWTQDSTEYNKASKQGNIELEFHAYSKQALKLNPVFRLDRLVSNDITMNLDEFQVQMVSAIKFHTYLNMLCLDFYVETEAYTVVITMINKFAECYKTLVDCFFDVGQFQNRDNIRTEKPFGPFAKLLDQCDLSDTSAMTVKQYSPLLNGSPTQKVYFVGSGNYDDACFPGNILIGLIDFDHDLAQRSRLSTPSPFVENTAEVESDFWKKNVLLNYVKPIYHSLVLGGIDMVKELAEDVTPVNLAEGKILSETKVEDILPLKINA